MPTTARRTFPAYTGPLAQPKFRSHDESVRLLVEGVSFFEAGTYHQGEGPSTVMRQMALATAAALRDIVDRGQLTPQGRDYAERYAVWFDSLAETHTAS